jgi:hypothetical protein
MRYDDPARFRKRPLHKGGLLGGGIQDAPTWLAEAFRRNEWKELLGSCTQGAGRKRRQAEACRYVTRLIASEPASEGGRYTDEFHFATN